MTVSSTGLAAPQAARGVRKYHFLVWRWHFYAGLYVIPFLIMLAVTGLVMLWISWVAGTGSERMAVVPAGTPLPVSRLQVAAEVAVPGGQAVQYLAPLAADRVAAFVVDGPQGRVGVALNPYTAEVLHSFPWRAGWYDLASEIHGSLLIGTFGDRLIEIAASLGILLIASGLYLHWPRQAGGWRNALMPRLSARGRSFWKSLHGVTGFWISALLLLFLLSGLSWAGIWGGKFVQAWSSFPAQKWDDVPVSASQTHAAMNHGAAHEVPWALEQTPLPVSGSLAGQPAITGKVDIDKVAELAAGLGFQGRYQINLPKDDSGVWTISHDSMSNDGPDPGADRTLHIDRHSGRVLADIRYDDYSTYAKAMAWGIAFHEGDLGLWNLVLNSLFCISVIVVSVSGVVMWWRRRPQAAARLAAPPRAADAATPKGLTALLLLLGLAFPLGGAAILAAMLLDRLLLRQFPALRQALS